MQAAGTFAITDSHVYPRAGPKPAGAEPNASADTIPGTDSKPDSGARPFSAHVPGPRGALVQRPMQSWVRAVA